jgi:hypothetical protein
MIIAEENVVRQSSQDDIILYDRSIVPPILVSPNHAPEGVFLYNSVIARIEVKSTVSRADLVTFVRASRDIASLKHSVQPGFNDALEGAFNLLFAYESDATGKDDPNFQLKRLISVMREQEVDPLSGLVSMICVPPYGFWKIGLRDGGQRCWQRLTLAGPENSITWFAACVSNSCFFGHARRQGRDPVKGLEGGIGMYLTSPFEAIPEAQLA